MEQYYIQLYSIHGLIRFHDAEIGKDRDTGGQVKYVLELLENLSHHPNVRKVDLFTRRIVDRRVSNSYGKPIEKINEKARIVRIECGGLQYKPKETLWNHVDEFVDKAIRFIKSEGDIPDVVHGHYADANYVAEKISKIFGLPFLSTGHSLGLNKKKILLHAGMEEREINAKFKMPARVAAEEKTLETADTIIVSTRHEIDTQYRGYNNRDKAKFEILPPGINTEVFFPFYRLETPGFKLDAHQEQALYRVNTEIERFLFQPDKPLILSIGRADKRKNFETIINSYGLDKELQAMANLAIFAGVRRDIAQMSDEEQEILTNLLLLMDKYDLYGKMALPKKNDPIYEVPEIYRVAARKKGVFVNATPGENFGLTLIEAAACGLPVVASPTGGPKEIIENAQNGMLVDIEDPMAISNALKKIISDTSLWEKFSVNGVIAAHNSYSWESHVQKYIGLVAALVAEKKATSSAVNAVSFGKKMTNSDLFFITDLDGTLVDGERTDGLEELKNWLSLQNGKVVFGISSGRNLELAKDAISKYNLQELDVVICSVGTEIYYTQKLIPDSGWQRHINYQWNRAQVEKAFRNHPKLKMQPSEGQTAFKVSYFVDENFTDDDLAAMYARLAQYKVKANILVTDYTYLDIVPLRAGKGNALRYLSYKWNKPLHQFITSGNGGNDIGMLIGKQKGIVVSNHGKELEILKGRPNIYFARSPIAKGILEGIQFYLKKKSNKPHR